MQHWSLGEGSVRRCDMNAFYLEEVVEALRTEDMGWGQSTEWEAGGGLGHTREKGPYLRERLRMRNWEEDGEKRSQKGWRKSRSPGYQGAMKDHVPGRRISCFRQEVKWWNIPDWTSPRCLWGLEAEAGPRRSERRAGFARVGAGSEVRYSHFIHQRWRHIAAVAKQGPETCHPKSLTQALSVLLSTIIANY